VIRPRPSARSPTRDLFDDGVLNGLKLVGFSIWERRGNGGRNVTFPARTYSVSGERLQHRCCGR
jgi:hypothetical protein